MIRIRYVYPDELSVYKRLFYLTEKRNLTNDDYILKDGYIHFKPNISLTLDQILQRMEIETIWSPIWVEGLARGFFSNSADVATEISGLSAIPEISWSVVHSQVVFIDRNQYNYAKELVSRFRDEWVFLQNVPWKRIVVGGMANQPNIGDFWKIPDNLDVRVVESYLLNGIGFIFDDPNWKFYDILKKKVINNYLSTRSRRVPGGRAPQKFADLGWSVKLDSFDELQSLLNPILQKQVPKGVPLHFPFNPDLYGVDAKIWELPIAVGDEDIHLELSYYRNTGKLDSEYSDYRQSHILNLDPDLKNRLV